MMDRVTLVTITHFQQNPEQYGGIGPPSTEFMQQMIESVYDRIPSVKKCRHILIYNKPYKRTVPEQKTYLHNLQALSDKYDLEFYTQPNYGLREAVIKAVEKVVSPYVFFIEHDWEFVQQIPMSEIVRLLDECDSVNYVRFNKKENRFSQNHVMGEKKINGIPFTKVNTFSNNPHITRTEFLAEMLDIAYPKGIRSVRKIGFTEFVKEFIRIRLHDNPRNDDIERVVNSHYRKRIQEDGSERVQSALGIYMYGGIGDGPYISHLGSCNLKSYTDSLYEIMFKRFYAR